MSLTCDFHIIPTNPDPFEPASVIGGPLPIISEGLPVDTELTEIAVGNWEPELSVTMESATKMLPVDTGITSLDITNAPTAIALTSWAEDTVDVNIISQEASIEAESSGIIASKDNALQISYNIGNNKGAISLPEAFWTKRICIYKTSFAGDSRYEVDEIIGAAQVENLYSGIEIDITPGTAEYHRKTRFFPYSKGETMTVYSLVNTDFSGITNVGINYMFGLEELSGKQVRFECDCNSNPTLSKIQIVVETTDYNDTLKTKTIPQTAFNVDTLDGSGDSGNESGYLYSKLWAAQKFFILTDNNWKYVFGMIIGTSLLPFHIFSGNDNSIAPEQRFREQRPFLSIVRDNSTPGVGDAIVSFRGFSIYKTYLPIRFLGTLNVVPKTFTRDDYYGEQIFFAARVRDSGRDEGRYTMTNMRLGPSRRAIIRVYAATAEKGSVDTTYPDTLGGLEYTVDPVSDQWTPGHLLYTYMMPTVREKIDISDNIDWKSCLGYGMDASERTVLFCTSENVNPADNADFSMTYYLFFGLL